MRESICEWQRLQAEFLALGCTATLTAKPLTIMLDVIYEGMLVATYDSRYCDDLVPNFVEPAIVLDEFKVKEGL